MAYNSLLFKRRKEIHEKIGKAIEELYPDRLEEFYEVLAYHYSRSENLKKSAEYLKSSGQKAAMNGAFQEAYTFYKETVSVLKKMGKDEGTIKSLIEGYVLLSRILIGTNFPENSLPMMQEGAELAISVGDEKNLARFTQLSACFIPLRGDMKSGKLYAEKCFYVANKIQDIGL